MIVTGGFNVYSVQVEQVLLAHTAVQDCAVVGVPHDKWGEAVLAVVQLKPDMAVAAEELIAAVKKELGGVHAPKQVVFSESLPRSPNGKVLKREIRDQYWAGHGRAVG
jgi:acyl-CoA synthetase (AMP-forming)/AMP-acid ligase II